MKFAHKMICLLVLVLSASFGLGGCWLLYSDFAVQRRTVLTADAALHSQICTDVQTDLLDRQRRGLEMGGAVAAARLALHQQPAALWQGEELVSSNIPVDVNAPLADGTMTTVRSGGGTYALFASELQGGYRIVTAYDLTALYTSRNAAVRRFLGLEAVVLAAYVVCRRALRLATRLTAVGSVVLLFSLLAAEAAAFCTVSDAGGLTAARQTAVTTGGALAAVWLAGTLLLPRTCCPFGSAHRYR